MSCMKLTTNVPWIKTSPFFSLKEIPGGDSPNYEWPRPCIYPDCPVCLLNALYCLRWPSGARVLLLIFRGLFKAFYFPLIKKWFYRNYKKGPLCFQRPIQKLMLMSLVLMLLLVVVFSICTIAKLLSCLKKLPKRLSLANVDHNQPFQPHQSAAMKKSGKDSLICRIIILMV